MHLAALGVFGLLLPIGVCCVEHFTELCAPKRHAEPVLGRAMKPHSLAETLRTATTGGQPSLDAGAVASAQ